MNRTTLLTSSSLIRHTIASILIVCFGLSSAVSADDLENDSPEVKYRQKVMSIIGTNMGAMGDIMKNHLALPGHVAVHAGQMASMAQLIAPAFKKNIASDATDAKPKIWRDWTKFEAAISDFEEAARNLEAAARGGDAAAVGPAMKALGKRCGNCHKPFRRPKEESFKNKPRNHDHDHHDDDGDE